jgi:hypothetical protein
MARLCKIWIDVRSFYWEIRNSKHQQQRKTGSTKLCGIIIDCIEIKVFRCYRFAHFDIYLWCKNRKVLTWHLSVLSYSTHPK